MCLDARILLVMNGSDGQIVLQSAKDRFDLRELNLVSPQHGRIFPAKIRAQQIMTFAAKGLPELVLSQGEGERLRVDQLLRLRHLHFHQVIDATRLGFGGSQFQQQVVREGRISMHAVVVNVRTNQSIENRQDVPAVFHHAGEYIA